MPAEKIIYSDIDLAFGIHPITKQLRVLKNNDAITQALKILIFTDKYDRLFQPNIFTNVKATLFENFTAATLAILQNWISTAINNHEKRATILELRVQENRVEDGINISITYASVTNSRPITVTIFLERLR